MKSFIQEIIINNATPEQAYKALVNPIEHSNFTGATAENTDSMDDDFSAYDGYIIGRNIELIPKNVSFKPGKLQKTIGRKIITAKLNTNLHHIRRAHF